MYLKTDKILGVGHQILQGLYREATPSANFDFLLEIYEGQPTTWRKDYKLRRERQLGIFHTICASAKCTKLEKIAIAGLIKEMVPLEG